MNPFESRSIPMNGPGYDMLPVTPSDSEDLPKVASSLYVVGGGNVRFVTPAGNEVTVAVPDYGTIKCGALKVFSTNTTATNIFAYTIY